LDAATADWFRRLTDHFGPIPDHYLVIDVETSGLDTSEDLILQIGWCEVWDRKVHDNGGVVLDWTRHRYTNQAWLESKLNRTRRIMESKGSRYHWTPAVLSQGIDPIQALADLFAHMNRPDILCLVGHNAWGYDARIIESQFRRFLYQECEFDPHSLWDTGAFEKASQLGTLPKPGENLATFCKRVLAFPKKGIKWSLSDHCVERYKLRERHSLDTSRAHTAPYDALVTSLLLETFRELAETARRPIPKKQLVLA
jgi:DNA polymerase III epsilon subunit-like protein